MAIRNIRFPPFPPPVAHYALDNWGCFFSCFLDPYCLYALLFALFVESVVANSARSPLPIERCPNGFSSDQLSQFFQTRHGILRIR